MITLLLSVASWAQDCKWVGPAQIGINFYGTATTDQAEEETIQTSISIASDGRTRVYVTGPTHEDQFLLTYKDRGDGVRCIDEVEIESDTCISGNRYDETGRSFVRSVGSAMDRSHGGPQRSDQSTIGITAPEEGQDALSDLWYAWHGHGVGVTRYLATSMLNGDGKKCFKKIAFRSKSKYSVYERLNLELAGSPHFRGISAPTCDSRTGEFATAFTPTWLREICLAVDVTNEELAAQLRRNYPPGKRIEGTYVNISVSNR